MIFKLRLLQNHYIVCFLSGLGCSIDGANIQLQIILHFFGMDDQENMDIFFCGQHSQLAYHFLLQVEFGIADRLGAEHELKIVDANDLNIVHID
jgi:hypothetical protein